MKLSRLIYAIFLVLGLILSPINANSQCNTNISICTPGVAGPFTFSPASANPSSCLDYTNGQATPAYAYITLYITSSGPLNLLINGDQPFGCLDVAIFDITGQPNPCASLGLGTEIGCNYASACDGCNEFGSTFPGCLSEVPAPFVNAGDVIMILVEDWDFTMNNFTLELSNTPGSAQTGPGDPTITPAGPFCSSDANFLLTAANGGGVWSGTGVTPGGVFSPSGAGPGVHNITYTLGQPPCQSVDNVAITVNNCSVCTITNMTANISACNPVPGDYTTNGIVEFVAAPAGGQLIVQDCNGNQQAFNPPFVSPTAYNITGQTPDGLACDVTAFFTSTPACTQTIPYVAPTCPCNMDSLNALIGLCDGPTDTYPMSGNFGFTSGPAGGQLIVEVDNGTTIYDTIINPPFVSPYNWSISGIPSDGAASTVTVYFSANPGCSISIPYNAPSSCFCNAQIGTFTSNITGGSVNNYVLCYGDQIDVTPNGDLTPPDEQFTVPPQAPPPPYDPGIWWFMYSCPPTVAVTPDPVLLPWVDDPCFLGAYNTQSLNDLNDLFFINSEPPGTFTDNIIYWVPITMYGMSTGTVSFVTGNSNPCYQMGAPYPVQYLLEFTSSDVEDCQAGTATVTVNGGLPGIDGSNFTASNLLPATATFANTTALDGGTIVINGLNGGEMWSFDVTDDNGCPYTVTGGPFPPLENPGFSYAPSAWCTADAPAMPIVTGTPGGTYSATPAGLTINAGNGQITPSTSTPGVYNVTYTTPGVCFDDSTFSVTISPTPTVDPILDQTVCNGSNFTAINFTGSLGATFNWVNNNTNTGLAAGGAGNIAAFAGTAAGAQEVSTVTVTPSVGGCIGTPVDFTLTVNPTEDGSFNYPGGLTYCQTGTDPTATITGTPGGTFSYVATAGGPFLDFNTANGNIVLATSNLGTYDITYTTAGACVASSTLSLVITSNLIANFSYGTYCANDTDPMPNFVSDDAGVPFASAGSGGVFSAVPAGLSINPGTGLVDLSASTPGTYTVTNTIPASGACPQVTYDDDIVINGLPNATISGAATVCQNDPIPDVSINVTAGTGGWTVDYTLNGAPNSQVIAAGPLPVVSTFNGGLGTYVLTQITDNVTLCSNTIAGQVVLDTYPTPTVAAMLPQNACEDANLIANVFTGSIPGTTFSWTNSNQDVGFGMAGNGQIGGFTTVPGQADITVTPYGPNPTAASPLGCVGPTESFTIIVSPNPVIDFSADVRSGCEPLTVTFTNNTANSSGCVWLFGDGSTVTGCGTVSNTYAAGLYDVTLTVYSAQGCASSLNEPGYIEVFSNPIASFNYAPQEITVEDPIVEFTNTSFNADSYDWNFGDGLNTSVQQDPIHEFPIIPGNYMVTLWAYNNGGQCADMYQQLITIQDVLIYYVPNVFTPDGDDYNETFQPIFTSGFDRYDWHMTIFNRWGEIIFESFDDQKGWNGHYGDGGLVEDGVYIWQIEFKESQVDRLYELRGHVTVLK